MLTTSFVDGRVTLTASETRGRGAKQAVRFLKAIHRALDALDEDEAEPGADAERRAALLVEAGLEGIVAGRDATAVQ